MQDALVPTVSLQLYSLRRCPESPVLIRMHESACWVRAYLMTFDTDEGNRQPDPSSITIRSFADYA